VVAVTIKSQLEGDTWTCHACGDTRPDAMIDTYAEDTVLKGSIPMRVSLRYCRDRPRCRAEVVARVKRTIKRAAASV
jgi:hypothetical protein